MIELKDLNGKLFILNCNLIETIESIPETKINLTNGRYLLVEEDVAAVVRKITEYNRIIFGPDKAVRVINEE